MKGAFARGIWAKLSELHKQANQEGAKSLLSTSFAVDFFLGSWCPKDNCTRIVIVKVNSFDTDLCVSNVFLRVVMEVCRLVLVPAPCVHGPGT